MSNEALIRNNWMSFYPGFHKICLKISPASYFDTRAMIVFSIGWGQLVLHLPIRSKIDDAEYPVWGFYFYGESKWWFDTFWICLGRKIKCFHMPWEYDWVRTSNLRKDGKWEHSSNKDRKSFYEDKWNDIIMYEEHPFTYVLKSGEVQNRTARIKTEEREWRWRAFKWLKYPSMIRRTISIDFNDEVGEETGSWKGGTTGCSYELLKGETPLQALRRMELNRNF